MIYLASPYSHPEHAVREHRFRVACRVAASIMRAGFVVFSPIAHSHCIAQFGGTPNNWEFWQRQDFAILGLCKSVSVLMLPGWKESVGVNAEIWEAHRLGLPVEYIDPVTFEESE